MKITSTLALAAALALGATTGCRPALVPLTQEIRDQSHLTEADLKNLQYYVSHTITLHRELESGGRQITGNHRLVLVAGKHIEEVVVEEKTPGICVGVGDHSLRISFEQGTSLEFSASGGQVTSLPGGFAQPPDLDPFPGNRPRSPELVPTGSSLGFTGTYALLLGPNGTVSFQGKSFDAIEDTARAALLIDAESLEEVVRKRKVLPGLRLPSK